MTYKLQSRRRRKQNFRDESIALRDLAKVSLQVFECAVVPHFAEFSDPDGRFAKYWFHKKHALNAEQIDDADGKRDPICDQLAHMSEEAC